MLRLKRLWELTGKEIPEPEKPIVLKEEPKEEILSFFSFPCPDCQQEVKMERIEPGEAGVLECENCSLSVTVYNPSLIIRRTKEIPREIQNKIWGELSQ